MSYIFLEINSGFEWFRLEQTHVKGYGFDDSGKLLKYKDLAVYFLRCETAEEFITATKTLNGCFAVVSKKGNKIFMFSDISRIFPLFYTLVNYELYVSDNVEQLIEIQHVKKQNQNSLTEFYAAGFCFGQNTLIENIQQNLAAQYLIFEANVLISTGFSNSYATKKISHLDYAKLYSNAIEHFENAFKRTSQSIENKPIVLPLSGGFDSRLIAVMLKKLGFSDVICFTFGRPNNFEVENSKKTAEALNFKWLFVEYTTDLIANFTKTETFERYINFAGKYSSMPYLQEYFAVKYLFDNNLVPKNSVFIPGHSGDFLGGSQFVKVFNSNIEYAQLATQIVKKKYIYRHLDAKTKQKKQVDLAKYLSENYPISENILPYSIFEDMDIKEKITKFVFNSSSVFLFFGYEVRFPFWDIELIIFFKTVPTKHKEMKKLYDDILVNHYFMPYKLNFEKEIQPTKTALILQKIKPYLKPYLPKTQKEKITIRNDWKNYAEITKVLCSELSENLSENYNSRIITWYAAKIKSQFPTHESTSSSH